jgi:hypothetical protein
VSGKVQIEWLYSDVFHCRHCVSRVSVLTDENTCTLSYYHLVVRVSKIKTITSPTGKNYLVRFARAVDC